MGTSRQRQTTVRCAEAAKPQLSHPAHRQQNCEVHPILRAQQMIGNHAVRQLLQSRVSGPQPASATPVSGQHNHYFSHIQPKLKISHSRDKYEQEADRVADRVLHMTGVQLKQPCTCDGQCSTTRKGQTSPQLQLKSRHSSNITTDASRQSLAMQGEGSSLSREDLSYFEPRFGVNFSNVRIHDTPQADAAARSIGALAYTVGSDVVFRSGQYNGSASGRWLLAHELSHVVQQTGVTNTSGAAAADANPHGISTGIATMISRYSHQDCTDADLRNHIWPADRIARDMVNRAIAALSNPLTAHVRDLMMKNFNDASAATVTAVLENFKTIKEEFDDDDYQYECEDDCDSANAYVYGFWTDIHLCMNNLGGRSNHFIAGVIVHEMAHYSAGTDDNEYFYPGSGQTTLSVDDAIDNSDSYEGFVGRL